jgi:hypothetical protein
MGREIQKYENFINFNTSAMNADGKHRHVPLQLFLILHIILHNQKQGTITILNTSANQITEL